MLACAPAAAAARDVIGVAVPEAVQAGGKALALNGTAVRSVTLFHVKTYVAAFYLPARAARAEDVFNSAGPMRFDFHFVISCSKEKMAKSWRYQFKESGTHDYPGLAEDVERVAACFGPIEKSTVQSFELEGEETRLLENGKPVGTLRGRDFQKAFLSLWFGARPVTEEIKAGLLGAVPAA